jgi:uncharacterized protein (TIGR03435 family)
MTALANHLWQSTVFAALAALLTLIFRRNHARTRHAIWLAASLKFLVPFGLLMTLGSRIAPPNANPAGIRLPFAIEDVSRPLAVPAAHFVPVAPSSVAVPLAALLLAIWARGLTGIAWSTWTRWRRMRTLVRDAAPVDLPLAIEVRATPSLVEPGVFGFFRPVLLLPEHLADRLTPAQLRAVVAHELCHVRRRDNLAAAIHMIVEALFWFHPMVWWIGARLVEERERACDEDVLRQGNEPEAYAEGILAACKLYLRSPLACVSGVAGADLNGRIERILGGAAARDLGVARTLLLVLCAAVTVGGPIAAGLATAPRSYAQTAAAGSFEVASVKPSRPNIRGMNLMHASGKLTAKNVPLEWIIAQAFEVYPYRLLNAPGWIHSTRYDIEGKAANPQATKAELNGMLQSLLAERFHLATHREKRDLPVYALVIGKSGPMLKPPEKPDGPHGVDYRNGGTILLGRNATMEELADALSFRMGRTVTDRTGLKDRFDFRLEFTPDEFVAAFGEEKSVTPDLNGTNIFTAIQEQLGLKLESGKGPVEMIVIDRVERPTEN